MKKTAISLMALFACACIFASAASAYWIWTPETKKFVNPKWAPKDSPKEQFDWAMSFYNARDYKRAATEFEKITRHYEYSEYAPRAQYYVGLSYESMEKFYTAFENYQKAIDNFPHIENLDEIIAREFNIGKIYASKDNPKVMGADIMAPLDRAIDIFKKVVENAPYGRLADEAQANMAETLKRSERFDEAAAAYQRLLDDYPNSKFSERARFEVADCAYRASLKPAYDSTGTDKAIKAFQDFTQVNRDSRLSKKADKTVQRLRDNMAQKSVMTAEFYEGQGKYRSAIIYYKDVIDSYPDSSFVDSARAKVGALKAKLAQPKTNVLDMFKKKDRVKAERLREEISEAAPAQKKGWSFFGPGKSKPEETAAEARAPEQKKKGWSFFGPGKSKPEEIAKESVEGISEAAPAQKKGWSFFGLGKSKPKEMAAEKPKVAKWTPLNFTKQASPEIAAAVQEEKPQTIVAEEKKEEAPQAASAPQAESAAVPAEPAALPVPAQEAVDEAKAEIAVDEARTEAALTGEAQPRTAAVEEAPQAIQAAPKKEGWTPLNFNKPAKPKETAAEARAPEQKKKGWSLFGLGKSKPKEMAAEKPKVAKWTPLNFNKPAKPEEITKESVEGISEAAPAQKKGWSFFGLGKSKPKEMAAEKPKVAKWTPLNFTKQASPEIAAAVQEEKPQTIVSEEKKEDAPQAAPAPQAESAAVPAEPAALPVPAQEAVDEAKAQMAVDEARTEAALTGEAQPRTAAVRQTPQDIQPAPKKGGWTPLNFNKPAKLEEEVESEGPRGMRWTPLNFTKGAKPEEVPSEKPKAWKWAPLNFTREEKALAETEQAAAPKKDGWVPLNFTKDTKFQWQGFR